MYPGEADVELVQATFQVIYVTGWSPAPTQPKALRRGSATVSMKSLQDASKVDKPE